MRAEPPSQGLGITKAPGPLCRSRKRWAFSFWVVIVPSSSLNSPCHGIRRWRRFSGRMEESPARGSREDPVVPNGTVVIDHHVLYERRNDGGLGLGSGKGADRIERLPFGDYEEFHAARQVAPKD